MITSDRDIRDELRSKGFSHISKRDLKMDYRLEEGLALLAESYHNLPPDPYCVGDNRLRRHQRFTALPWKNAVLPRPCSTYFQDAGFNAKSGGIRRVFEGLSTDLLESEFLADLILFDLNNSIFDDDELAAPIDVGVHLVRLRAEPDKPGVSSPDCLHKDGEPFTWIHLIRRDAICGGESVVANNAKQIIFEATLREPLDSLVVSDEAVYHHVNRVCVEPGYNLGFRDVLLIDFTPMRAIPLPPPA